ncbi:MAG TPA: ATP-binding protein [Gemmatimonadaceae bacterium]|nr:ATP-binding protein [Gemmatimonadaceae bacterium]
MPRKLLIPQEPIARFRLLSVAFAVLFGFGNIVVFATYSVPSPAARWSAAVAGGLLSLWFLYGYLRGGFPVWGWIVDAVLVYTVTLHSPMPGHAIGVFYGGVQLRALYVSRRELWLLTLSYAIARIATVVVAPDPQPAYALATTTAFQIVALTIIAVTLHIFVSTVERRAAAERALQRSEERYRLVASGMRDVVYDWDPATGDIEWTESMQSVFGFSPQDVGNDLTWWLSRVHPEDREELQRTVRTALVDPSIGIEMVQYRVRRADESYAYASGSMVPQRDASGRVLRVIGAIRDVTTERRLEEQLRESQKMEAVGKLAGGVAHDFNNLLTVIGGHAFMLGRQIPRDGVVEKHLQGIANATDRAASLTKQLLAFSRRQILTPAVLDLNAILEDVMLMMQPVLGERIEVVKQLDPLLFPLFADAGQLAQVLVNLALNARDAMPQGGTLTIITANARIEDRPDDASAPPLAPGDYVRLTISDDGIGMDAETLARVFDPFFTTKPIGHGTGLGLATVYGIVKQSAGDVRVTSAPGAGASFVIHLPAVQPEIAVPETRLSPSRGIAGDVAPEILLVEDDDGVRDFVQAVLQRAGHRVQPASNGMDALRKLGDRHEAIDLVVADVVMPQMGGPEFVRQFRQRRPDVAVLFITGYTDDARMLAEIASSGARLLVKPFSADDLERTVASMLGTERVSA